MAWSEQQRIEFQAPEYLRNIIRVITESGLRLYKELMPMKKEQVDLENAVVWIPDSKTPNGIAEVPLTDLAREAFREQIRIAGQGPWLFPSDENPTGHQKTFVGTSANAVRTQVWTALIAMLVLKYLQLKSTFCWSLSTLAALRQQLFFYRDLYAWLDDPFQAPPALAGVHDDAQQLAISW
ncbi:MAG: tyrosine-type recombinase/integrase [Bryobacteraceae bacterium]